ncbi:MAG TPA: D-glucuronyl C5-epimerase family protein [Gaiellaceae bacterium]|nr:D-glucuronyl C5-epimerase family protein [Gaiellaceae bacterium]
MRGLVLVAAAFVALALAGAAPAATVTSLERTALAKLKRAPVSAETKTSARSEIARAAHLIRTLPNGRSYHILVSLQEVAAFRDALTQPRALALYGALKANDDYFTKHWAPADSTDIVGADGVVYRYFGGHCFRFHPLANFGVLNARATSGDVEGTEELADALVARGVYQKGGGIGWEYDFPFSGGKAPWLSGMAQAVAAQAFSRAATTVPENGTTYMNEATAAFRVIPKRLMTSVAAGPWIRLYAFSSLTVLNAQLQATLSLESYATASGDTQAQTLATRMQNAAAASLGRFDTGYWSYYALPSEPSPPDYHRYVVQLLTKLKTADPRFADAAARFATYEKEPPAFQLANGGVGQVRFWLSKPATVSVVTSAGPTKRLALLGGWHTFTWNPKRAGVYPVHITATDWNGHTFAIDAPPIVRVGPGAFNPVKPSTDDDTGTSPLVVANRTSLTWPDGATAPDPAIVAGLATTPAPVLLELDALTPATPAFAQYAASLAQQLPNLTYLTIGAAPTAATAAQYVATVSSVRDAVHAVAPAVAIGVVVDGAAAPKQTVAALGRAGAVADVLAFHAAPAVATGAWLQPNITVLTNAFAGTLPPLLLDAPSAATVTGATCGTGVTGVALDPAAPDAATQAAVAAFAHGTVVCPGLAATPMPTIEFPTGVTSGTPVTVQLACTRDCLYVATLVGADGRAVVATRGSLAGGAAAKTVSLPKTQLGQASYTIDLRIVNTVNPGRVLQFASPPLSRG